MWAIIKLKSLTLAKQKALSIMKKHYLKQGLLSHGFKQSLAFVLV